MDNSLNVTDINKPRNHFILSSYAAMHDLVQSRLQRELEADI